MKKIILPLLAAALSCAACHAAEAQLPVGGKISSLKVSDNIKVYYTVAPATGVTAKAPKRFLAQVHAEVKGNELRIYTSGNINMSPGEKIEVYVTAPAVKSFTAKDNSDIYIQSALNADKLTLHATDNSDIKTVGITAEEAWLSARDNSDLKVRGTLRAQKISLTSSDNSDIKVTTVSTTNLTVISKDNSKAKCKDVKTSTLSAQASDNSDIELYGHAANVTFTASDMGKIDTEELTADRGTARASDMSTIKCRVKNLSHSASDMSHVHNNAR